MKLEKEEFVRRWLAHRQRKRKRMDREVLSYRTDMHYKYVTGRMGRRTAGRKKNDY